MCSPLTCNTRCKRMKCSGGSNLCPTIFNWAVVTRSHENQAMTGSRNAAIYATGARRDRRAAASPSVVPSGVTGVIPDAVPGVPLSHACPQRVTPAETKLPPLPNIRCFMLELPALRSYANHVFSWYATEVGCSSRRLTFARYSDASLPGKSVGVSF